MSRDYTAVLVANFQCNENDRFYGEVSVTLKFIVFVSEIDALNCFLRLQEKNLPHRIRVKLFRENAAIFPV